ncbi:MAG: T9SS type A sorting domain-containing protein [Phaeodactylibacter sp.]|nr:T9SS type A sorting domain-containing protein [Phaeodactylibacter sp.]
MKIFTTTILSLFLAFTMANAQVVYVNSPADLVGGYTFGTGDYGTQLTDTVITADAVFVDDGSGETATQGCGAAVNGADLTGKIALVDRGSCQFGTKCLNAETAGAIGVIIFNNQPGVGVINMAGGDDGGMVTVPVAMLDYEAGQAIRTALENGAVNITMGNLVLPNDVGAAAPNIMVAPYGVVPIDQVTAENFTFVPGSNVFNNGSNAASNLNVSATIEYAELDGSNPTEVYNESGTLEETIDPDSTSSLLTLAGFEPANGIGRYTTTYQVGSDSTDQLEFDNSFTSTFAITDSIYCKGGWDFSTGRPNVTIYYSTGGGGVFEMLSSFKFPNGSGLRIDTIIVDVLAPSGSTLAGEPFEAYVYEWIDADADGLIANAEVTTVGVSTVAFPEDFADQTGELTLPVIDFNTFAEPGPIVNPDATTYFVGIRYTGENQAFIGVDEDFSHQQYLDFLTANGALTDGDYPYFVVSTFDPADNSPDFETANLFTDVFAGLGLAIKTAPIATNTEEVVGAETFEMEIFPNPTAERITTNLTFKESTSFVEYSITSATGQVLLRQRDSSVAEREQAEFNVKALPAGQYFLMIRTEQGIQTKTFIKN